MPRTTKAQLVAQQQRSMETIQKLRDERAEQSETLLKLSKANEEMTNAFDGWKTQIVFASAIARGASEHVMMANLWLHHNRPDGLGISDPITPDHIHKAMQEHSHIELLRCLGTKWLEATMWLPVDLKAKDD